MKGFFTDISDKLTAIKTDIGEKLNLVKENLLALPAKIAEGLKGFFDGLGEKLSSVIEGILSLPAKMIGALRDFLIPKKEDIDAVVQDNINRIKTAFGIGAVDLSGILGRSTEIADHTGSVDVYGLGTFNGTFLKVDYLVTAVTTFRPYIRGFLALLLIFYNIRQFFGLFRIAFIDDGGNASDGGDKS